MGNSLLVCLINCSVPYKLVEIQAVFTCENTPLKILPIWNFKPDNLDSWGGPPCSELSSHLRTATLKLVGVIGCWGKAFGSIIPQNPLKEIYCLTKFMT